MLHVTTRMGLPLTATVALACITAVAPPAAAAPPAADPQAVAEVRAGERETANAAWWGFDETDATAALQAAIDSGARRVVVPNVGKPWIVRPITLRSDLELVLEAGVEVLAKRGEFRGKNDSLFTATRQRNITIRGDGATLRMHKADYASPDYPKAEWRMGIALRSCDNVRIYGLTIASTGGDGIYLGVAGADWPACRDVHIKGVVCDDNYRQGISVISAENLLIEDCVFSNTAGTAPAAGLDLEPNVAHEMLRNVVVRNCVAENNEGGGFFVYAAHLRSHGGDDELSVRFENCRVLGGASYGLVVGALRPTAPAGAIEFVDCVVKGTAMAGGYVYDKHPGPAAVRFVRCRFEDVANAASSADPDAPPINVPLVVFLRRPAMTPASGGVAFVDCHVIDDQDRPVIAAVSRGEGPTVQDLRGVITADVPGTARVDLGDSAARITLEVRPARR